MLENEIKAGLLQAGASLVGFSDISGNVPRELSKSMHYAVTIAYKLSDSVLATITDRPSIMYFQHYRVVNTKP